MCLGVALHEIFQGIGANRRGHAHPLGLRDDLLTELVDTDALNAANIHQGVPHTRLQGEGGTALGDLQSPELWVTCRILILSKMVRAIDNARTKILWVSRPCVMASISREVMPKVKLPQPVEITLV